MRWSWILLCLSLVACGDSGSVPIGVDSVRYLVTINSTWSATTHPSNFPGNPHYSPWVGVNHNSNIRFWQENFIASDGVEQMAENGNNSALESEFVSLDSDRLINESGMSSPAKLSFEITVSQNFPLVTLVSMLAPSPDWFVGVDSLNLFEDGSWVQEKSIDMLVYDAGTDDGISYNSDNADTQPPVGISRLTSNATDFINGLPAVGTIQFELQ